MHYQNQENLLEFEKQKLLQNLLEASGSIKAKEKRRKAVSNAMNGRDADMMEADATAPPSAAGSLPEPNDVRNWLTMARQLVDQGKPSQALQAVVFLSRVYFHLL